MDYRIDEVNKCVVIGGTYTFNFAWFESESNNNGFHSIKELIGTEFDTDGVWTTAARAHQELINKGLIKGKIMLEMLQTIAVMKFAVEFLQYLNDGYYKLPENHGEGLTADQQQLIKNACVDGQNWERNHIYADYHHSTRLSAQKRGICIEVYDAIFALATSWKHVK